MERYGKRLVLMDSCLRRNEKYFGFDRQTSKKTKGQSKKFKVSVEDLPAGIYFVKVETGRGTIVKKFVKQ